MEVYSLPPESLMKTLRDRIDRDLRDFFLEQSKVRIDSVCMEVRDRIRDFTLMGGKRVRPMLVIMGHDLFSPPDDRVTRAAISIELTQSYLLIHDDIMDQSETRRGNPSLHASLRKHIERLTPDTSRISQNLAIVAGDLADSFAHQAILGSGLEPELLLRANMELSKIIETTGYGQLIDIDSSYNESFGQRDLLRLHILKTAKYTIEGPLLMGAMLSPHHRDLKQLSYYGNLLGTAFQLHDDILGLFGDEQETGKSIKSDVNEGKKTLLILKAIENSHPSDQEFLKRTIRSGNVTDSEFQKIRKIVMDSGSYDYSRRMIARMIGRCKDYLGEVQGDQRIKSFLSWFADYIVERKN